MWQRQKKRNSRTRNSSRRFLEAISHIDLLPRMYAGVGKILGASSRRSEVNRVPKDKVVLAYSGGLDTSVPIRWIPEHYDMDVIALTIDVGGEKDVNEVRQRALKAGAAKALVVDAREEVVRDFV